MIERMFKRKQTQQLAEDPDLSRLRAIERATAQRRVDQVEEIVNGLEILAAEADQGNGDAQVVLSRLNRILVRYGGH